MSKGIIYCMTTIVPGLVKIGKTGSDNFEGRMYHLEHNGYSNVVGLKRCFAIEVEDYDEKERLIDDIFSKSRVGNTELFALDINLVKQILSSLDGKQVYPEDKSKDVIFEEATESRGIDCIPDGEYHFNYKPHDGEPCNAVLKKVDGKIYLARGSQINSAVDKIGIKSWSDLRSSKKFKNGIAVEDIECDSLSMAASLVRGRHSNGWVVWKTDDGKAVDVFRKIDEEEK